MLILPDTWRNKSLLNPKFMETPLVQYSNICKKALGYRDEAEKHFDSIVQEISSAREKKDVARLEMHRSNITMTFESLKNHVISIQLSEMKKLAHINVDELDLVMKGAENTLATIAHQNAALKGAIGMTAFIPDKK
jgi:hypothetical protein